jgi:hypothetical protein
MVRHTSHFWTHGTSVIPEQTPYLTGASNGLQILRAGWGARVSQNPGTRNWFHFAIPTPTILDHRRVDLKRLWLRARVSDGPVIEQVDVRMQTSEGDATELIARLDRDDGVHFTGRAGQFEFDTPDKRCVGPVVLCVNVNFVPDMRPPENFVFFWGAGADFEEYTV